MPTRPRLTRLEHSPPPCSPPLLTQKSSKASRKPLRKLPSAITTTTRQLADADDLTSVDSILEISNHVFRSRSAASRSNDCSPPQGRPCEVFIDMAQPTDEASPGPIGDTHQPDDGLPDDRSDRSDQADEGEGREDQSDDEDFEHLDIHNEDTAAAMDALFKSQQEIGPGPLGSFPDRPMDVSNAANSKTKTADSVNWTNKTMLAKDLGVNGATGVDALLQGPHVQEAVLHTYGAYYHALPKDKPKQNTRQNVAEGLIAAMEDHGRRQLSEKKRIGKWDSPKYHAYMLWKLHDTLVVRDDGALHHLRAQDSDQRQRDKIWALILRAKRQFFVLESGTNEDRSLEHDVDELCGAKPSDAVSSRTRRQRMLTHTVDHLVHAAVPGPSTDDVEDVPDPELGTALKRVGLLPKELDTSAMGGAGLVQSLKTSDLQATLSKITEEGNDFFDSEDDTKALVDKLCRHLATDDYDAVVWKTAAPDLTVEHFPRQTEEQAEKYMVEATNKVYNLLAAAKKAEKLPDADVTDPKIMPYLKNSPNEQVLSCSAIARMISVAPTGRGLHPEGGFIPEGDISQPVEAMFQKRQAIIDRVAAEDGRALETIATNTDGAIIAEDGAAKDVWSTGEILNNPQFEQGNTLDDFLNACKYLGLDPTKRLHLAGQKDGSHSLYWVQIMAIAFARRVAAGGLLKGALITALVGLGKSLMLSGLVLTDFADWVRAITKITNDHTLSKAERRDRTDGMRKNKPYLLIAPSALLSQLYYEFTQFSTLLDVRVHHSETTKLTASGEDVADMTSVPPSARISHHLKNTSAILNRLEGTKARVIISSTQTWTRRYGPSALQEYRLGLLSERLKRKEITKTQYNTLSKEYGPKGTKFTQPDRGWTGDMSGVFRILFVDEAQSIRNPSSQAHIALRWLHADQVHLTTATPITGTERDLRGFVQLLAPQANVDAFDALESELPNDVNPFSLDNLNAHRDASGELPTDRKRALLCVEALDKWATQAESLEVRRNATTLFFQNGMIRHSYSSSIPPGLKEFSIGAMLPACYRKRVDITLTVDQMRIYRLYSQVHLARLRISVDDSTNTVGINRRSTRALTYASGAPFLFLVGIPKGHPQIEKQTDKLEQWRKVYVELGKAADREMKRKKLAKDKKLKTLWEDEGVAAWDGYPNRLPQRGSEGWDEYFADGATGIRSKDQILREHWYKYESEYTLAECNPVEFFGAFEGFSSLDGTARTWPQEGRIWGSLLRLASQNDHVRELPPVQPEDAPATDDESSPAPPNAEAINAERAMTGAELFKKLELEEIPDMHEVEWSSTIREKILDALKKLAPRYMQALSQLFHTSRRGEKVSLWASIPTTQYLLVYFLRLVGIRQVSLLDAMLDVRQRNALINAFNKPAGEMEGVRYLVASPEVGGVGINLQKGHHVSIVFDAIETDSTLTQVIGRVFRLMQEWDVHVYIYHVQGTHDDWCAEHRISGQLINLWSNMSGTVLMSCTKARNLLGEEDDERFARTLMDTLNGFYYCGTVERASRLLHVTSFQRLRGKDDEPPLGTRTEKWRDVLYFAVPNDYGELDPSGVIRRIYELSFGVPVASYLEKRLTNVAREEDQPPLATSAAIRAANLVRPAFVQVKERSKAEIELLKRALELQAVDEDGETVQVWDRNLTVNRLRSLARHLAAKADKDDKFGKWNKAALQDHIHEAVVAALPESDRFAAPDPKDMLAYQMERSRLQKAKDAADKQNKRTAETEEEFLRGGGAMPADRPVAGKRKAPGSKGRKGASKKARKG